MIITRKPISEIKMKKISILFLTIINFCAAQQTFTNYQAANLVVGQSNFTNVASSCLQNGLNGPSYVAISSKGVLAVAQQSGGGVKLWNTVYDVNGKNADVIVGENSFVCGFNSPTQSLTYDVEGVAFSPDGNKLIISDAGNNRVLIWNTIPTYNGQPADVVIGQTAFTTNGAGLSNSNFNYPQGIYVSPSGKLFVSDRYNNRVLIWNTIPIVNGTAANVVVGQPDFVTNSAGNSASKLGTPWGNWVSNDGKLLIAEESNNRVMVWNTIPTTNGVAADVVIGQTGFNTSSSGISSSSMYIPLGVTVAPDGKLAIAEFGNSRVLIYNSIPTTNGKAADFVLGQPGFTTGTYFYPSGSPTSQNFATVYNTSFDLYGRLFVTGRNMNRTLIFGTLPTIQAELSVSMVSNYASSCTGSTNQLSVTVTNNSPTNATGVVASASFPASFSYISNTVSTGTYNANSGYWNVGMVPANSSVTLVVNGTIGSVGSYTASANILQSNQLDPNLINNGVSINYTISSNTTAAPTANTQMFCSGSTVANLVATGSNIQWYSAASNSVPLSNSTVLVQGTYYATQTIGGCESPTIAVSVLLPTKTWNGTSWDGNGIAPVSYEAIVFNGNYSSTSSVQGCSCTVNSGTVVFNAGHTLSLLNDIKVLGGSVTFNDTSSLLQTNNVTNTGNITYKRTTSILKNNYDFVYWGSPVLNQQLSSIWMCNYGYTFYTYNTNSVNWSSTTGNTLMTPGIGYISRAVNGVGGWSLNTAWNSNFIGVPNNGNYTTSIIRNGTSVYNLISNPYPSALDLESFYEDNNSVLNPNFFFWTHNTQITNNQYTSNDYAVYNAVLGVGVGTGNSAFSGGNAPDRYADSCQGFFAVANGSGGTALFKNSQRASGNNNGFYRIITSNVTSNPIEKHCLWLNFTNGQGLFKQLLLDYAQGATNHTDDLFDTNCFNGNTCINFYSLSDTNTCIIQSRALPFSPQDTVPLGYSSTISDTFSIAINHLDGLFENQNVFLEDTLLNQIHDLKQSPYAFNTDVGTFNNRFILRYNDNSLSNSITVNNLSKIKVYPNPTNSLLTLVKPGSIDIDKIIITDLTGEVVLEQTNKLNQIDVRSLASGIYILEVVSGQEKFTCKFLRE